VISTKKKKKENNRKGKTRDLFKKIRDTKGTFHAKMGLIKNRNGIDLEELTRIHRRTIQKKMLMLMLKGCNGYLILHFTDNRY